MKTVKVQFGMAGPHWIRPSDSVETGAGRYRLGHRSVVLVGRVVGSTVWQQQTGGSSHVLQVWLNVQSGHGKKVYICLRAMHPVIRGSNKVNLGSRMGDWGC